LPGLPFDQADQARMQQLITLSQGGSKERRKEERFLASASASIQWDASIQ
jgi:hypothetical protein